PRHPKPATRWRPWLWQTRRWPRRWPFSTPCRPAKRPRQSAPLSRCEHGPRRSPCEPARPMHPSGSVTMHDATIRGRTQAGNAVEIEIEWHDMAGEPEAPIAVVYEVFERGGAAISGSYATVPDPAAEMTIVVPGAALPGGTSK